MTRLRAVALNAMFLDPGVSGGTETYLRGLVPALTDVRPELEITVLTTGRGARALHEAGWSHLARVVSLGTEEGQRLRRLRAEQLAVPWHARRRRVDLVHSLGNTGPIACPVAHVLTVHDVQFFTTQALPPVSAMAFRILTKSAARHADGLVAVSAAARDEIARVLSIDPDRFTVAPHGPGRSSARPPLDAATVRERHALTGRRVVLCVAAKRPHKNQEALLRALEHLPGDMVVVLAGHPEGYDATLRTLAAQLGVGARVHFLDHVGDAELDGLWAVADCAVFPTRSEGFGLPLLEAMRRGVPVACSDLPVLREVGGDVPEYFDPDDPLAVAGAVEAAIAARDSSRAQARAAGFTWTASAERTLEAYERALAARARCTSD